MQAISASPIVPLPQSANLSSFEQLEAMAAKLKWVALTPIKTMFGNSNQTLISNPVSPPSVDMKLPQQLTMLSYTNKPGRSRSSRADRLSSVVDSSEPFHR
ncbi:hypothetical protein QQP08_003470 [Theobroma cacao]|nr:hypothetical protein QQP08_003470 [Theobroma cacao]